MDGLLSLLVSIFGNLSMLVVLPLVTLALGLLWLCSEFLFKRMYGPQEPRTASSSLLQKVPQAAGALILVMGLGSCFFLLLVSSFFYQDVLRWSLKRASSPNVRVSFQSAEGNFLTGHHTLYRIKLHRKGHFSSDFDLRLEKLEIDLGILSLLRFSMVVDKLKLKKLKGTIRFKRNTPPNRPTLNGYTSRNVLFTTVHLTAVDLNIVQGKTGSKKSFHLEIAKSLTQNLRSHTAWTDMMFRSQMRGHLQDHPFSVSVRTLSDGQETEWKMSGVSASLMARLIGGPMRWLTGGKTKLQLRSRWVHSQPDALTLHCKLQLESPKAALPENLSPSARRFSARFVDYVNAQTPRLLWAFQVNHNMQRWRGNTTMQIRGLNKALWRGVRSNWLRSINAAASKKRPPAPPTKKALDPKKPPARRPDKQTQPKKP